MTISRPRRPIRDRSLIAARELPPPPPLRALRHHRSPTVLFRPGGLLALRRAPPAPRLPPRTAPRRSPAMPVAFRPALVGPNCDLLRFPGCLFVEWRGPLPAIRPSVTEGRRRRRRAVHRRPTSARSRPARAGSVRRLSAVCARACAGERVGGRHAAMGKPPSFETSVMCVRVLRVRTERARLRMPGRADARPPAHPTAQVMALRTMKRYLLLLLCLLLFPIFASIAIFVSICYLLMGPRR